MQTLTAEQFKKKYGADAAKKFDTPADPSTGIFSEIKQAAQQGLQYGAEGIDQANSGGFGGLVSGVGKILGGATQVATAPLAPVLNRTLTPAINAVTQPLQNSPAVQKFAMSPAGEKTSQVAETVGNYANAAGLVGGVAGGEAAVPRIGEALKSAPKEAVIAPAGSSALEEASTYMKGAMSDVTPTLQNTIDHQLAKALDLTPGDLSNIEASTGNQVGRWLADNNLIGTNKVTTQAAIDAFKTQNYNAVRSEIGKVEQIYKPNQIPRFTDALKAIQNQIQGTVGLEKVNADIDNLLHKPNLTLDDVQHVKELMDDHFSLYKVTGDVASGVTKQGLANVRSGLKDFIEKQVQKYTGADIREMNNNVSTARSLSDAITTRSPRGLTRANITNRDIMTGLGLTYFGTPVVGIAYVLLKKLMTSPTVRLRVARYLDGLNDAQKLKISEQLQQGKVPVEVQKVSGPLP